MDFIIGDNIIIVMLAIMKIIGANRSIINIMVVRQADKLVIGLDKLVTNIFVHEVAIFIQN